jgi:HicA toxin of bacterial toxin-antitoxin,
MSRLTRELTAFKNCSGTYAWKDFAWLLEQLGYELKKSGKTAGSRRRYWHPHTGHVLMLDEQHDGEMRCGMVKRLQRELQEKGLI